jgi:hypothetical protein
LLTLESPLGLRMVRDRLPGAELGAAELGVAHWINVRDPNDPVTAAGALDRWYPGVSDRRADNGYGAHAAERYLSSKAVVDDPRRANRCRDSRLRRSEQWPRSVLVLPFLLAIQGIRIFYQLDIA